MKDLAINVKNYNQLLMNDFFSKNEKNVENFFGFKIKEYNKNDIFFYIVEDVDYIPKKHRLEIYRNSFKLLYDKYIKNIKLDLILNELNYAEVHVGNGYQNNYIFICFEYGIVKNSLNCIKFFNGFIERRFVFDDINNIYIMTTKNNCNKEGYEIAEISYSANNETIFIDREVKVSNLEILSIICLILNNYEIKEFKSYNKKLELFNSIIDDKHELFNELIELVKVENIIRY
jgi:hypothetical protein